MSKGSGVEHPRGPPGEVVGYTPDEKLRLQQLRELRRRWLKDQELSPREPVLPPRKLGPIEGFWERFLQPGGFWRQQPFLARYRLDILDYNSYYIHQEYQANEVFLEKERSIEDNGHDYKLGEQGTVIGKVSEIVNLGEAFFVFRTYKTGKFIILGGIIPLWLSHYIIKYHLMTMPYAVVSSKPKIYPGDVIQETGEVIPPLEIPSSHH